MSGNKTGIAQRFSEILNECKKTLTLLCQTADSGAACCVGLPQRQPVHYKQQP